LLVNQKRREAEGAGVDGFAGLIRNRRGVLPASTGAVHRGSPTRVEEEAKKEKKKKKKKKKKEKKNIYFFSEI